MAKAKFSYLFSLNITVGMEINKNFLKLIYSMFTISIDSFCPLKESWKISSWINSSFLIFLYNWAFPICFLISFCYGSYHFPILFPFNQVSTLLGGVQMNSCLIIRTSVGVAACLEQKVTLEGSDALLLIACPTSLCCRPVCLLLPYCSK